MGVEWFVIMLLAWGWQAFFSAQEFSILSLDRLQLHALSVQGSKRAEAIRSLLQQPAVLFATTLFMVNAALQVGSEAMYRFFLASDFPTYYAPFLQATVVTVFAELVPLYLARHQPERIALWGSPTLTVATFLCRPLGKIVGWVLPSVSRPLIAKEDLLHGKGMQRYETPFSQLFLEGKKSIDQWAIPFEMLPRISFDADRHTREKALLRAPFCSRVYCKNQYCGLLSLEAHQTDPHAPILRLLHTPNFFSTTLDAQEALVRLMGQTHRDALLINPNGHISAYVHQGMLTELFTHCCSAQHTPSIAIDRLFSHDTPWRMLVEYYGLQDVPDREKDVSLSAILEEHLGRTPLPNEPIALGSIIATLDENGTQVRICSQHLFHKV